MRAKRKKMMTRKQNLWKAERIASEVTSSHLGENISKVIQFMRKKRKSNQIGQNFIFDPSGMSLSVDATGEAGQHGGDLGCGGATFLHGL